MAAVYRPLIFDRPVRVKSNLYCDGKILKAVPTLNSRTITISATCGSASITPESPYSEDFDYFCKTNDEVEQLYSTGYRDAEMWISGMCSSGYLQDDVFNLKN